MNGFENSKGYLSLKKSVEADCNQKNSCGCFNPNGCPFKNASIGNYGEAGYKRCFHTYCDKFKWVIDRAKHYAEKTNIPVDEILNSWEENRNYWYMNYYQDAKQPLLGDSVKVFETVEDLKKSVDNKGFRCPYCKGVSSDPFKCDSGEMVKLINSKGKKEKCNWCAGGLFRTLGKGANIYIKEKRMGTTIFMPVAWESEVQNANH